METEPAESRDSIPPAETSETTEEPVRAVPTRETTPVWAQTKPVMPPEDSEVEAVDSEAESDESTPPVTPTVPSQGGPEKGDPDWSKSEASANGDSGKKTPEWAQTVPTSPGEPGDHAVAEDPAEPETVEDLTPVEAAATVPPMESTETEPPEVDETEITAAPITEPPKAVAADAMKSTWPPTAPT